MQEDARERIPAARLDNAESPLVLATPALGVFDRRRLRARRSPSSPPTRTHDAHHILRTAIAVFLSWRVASQFCKLRSIVHSPQRGINRRLSSTRRLWSHEQSHLPASQPEELPCLRRWRRGRLNL